MFSVSPQPEMSSSALISTSTDSMMDSQYLRVTLKSLTPIRRFVMKAVNQTHLDMAGLGTWYLPFQDNNINTGLSPTSRYLNCSDSLHNTVTNSPDIPADTETVIYFQWMPEQNYRGYVRFRALVVTGNNVDWEEATSIEVRISSSPTRRPNHSVGDRTTSQPETEDPTIDVDTTRWSHNHNHIGGETSTLTSNEEISSVVLPRVTESYEMLEAEHGGWRKSKNGEENVHAKLKLFFPLYLLYTYTLYVII